MHFGRNGKTPYLRVPERTVMNMTDEEIVSMLSKGDENGLTAAMSKYGRLVNSIASGMLTSDEDCEEVVSDTFYKLWNSRDAYDPGRGSLKTYICTIGRSCTLNRLRQLELAETVPAEERDLGIDVDFSTACAADHNRRVIAECIRSLPMPDRDIFIRRFYYSQTYQEISNVLGLDEKKIGYIIRKAKRRLRDALIKGGILL
ncbi:MAG: sigma-70 family RNA polymerase sigma factor [Ruminococcus sp.]|nr:sigma-70 family RNA polymerase sigma factor [Ruminococcus sp.]